MALTATLTYDPTTRTVTVVDSDATPGNVYDLWRLHDGAANQLLPTAPVSAGRAYVVPADGVYRLVLSLLTDPTEASQELLHIASAAHYEAVANSFDKLSARSPKGHPVDDCLKVLARVSEATSCVGESNPQEADRLLTTTNLPS